MTISFVEQLLNSSDTEAVKQSLDVNTASASSFGIKMS